jgi:AcrR family transcriptional regulator
VCPPEPIERNGHTPAVPARPVRPARARGDTEIARLRRRQIIDAARQIIAEQGIQLTYYFPHKEDVLLAVFDDMVDSMLQQVEEARRRGDPCMVRGAWDLIRHILGHLVEGPPTPEFGTLQFTFLSQAGHRDDFRQRLASLYDHWRTHMAAGLASVWPGVPAKAAASLVQAVFHGVVMQLTADPDAFDRAEFLALCDRILAALKQEAPRRGKPPRKAAAFRRRPTELPQTGESPR